MRSFVIFVAASAAAAANINVKRQTVNLSATVATSTVAIPSSAASTTTPTPPKPTAVKIHPHGVSKTCLNVAGGVRANGTAVQINDCNGSAAQNWIINPGSTQVRLNGTDFCLDAGSKPGNGVPMKIWTCFDNLPAQTWFYTGDLRIALQNQGQCLDLTSGSLVPGNRVQTWQCTTGNTNQVWTTSV